MKDREQTEVNLKDACYDDFQSRLNPNIIKLLNSEFKKKHLDIRNSKKGGSDGSRINKDIFIHIMYNIFLKELKNESLSPLAIVSPLKIEENREKYLMMIIDNLFRRFKSVNLDIRAERLKNLNTTFFTREYHDYYYVNEISNDNNEIDTYEFICALAMYPNIDFKEKMRLLFEITDVDEDGYINEEEIRGMILVVNFLFCDEDSQIKSTSTIINQSLASIKSQQIFNMIMRYPGELYKVVSVEKYVDFDQFYEAITKIENYKYYIIPSFINFKTSLSIKKSEPEYEIDKKNVNDFLSITNEVCSNVKFINNEIIRGSKDIRKLIDSKFENKNEKLTKKKKNYIDQNIKHYKHNQTRYIENDSENHVETHTTLPIIQTVKGKEKLYQVLNKKHQSNNQLKDLRTSSLPSEMYSLSYNKIANLETHPGKIKIKENVINFLNINDKSIIKTDHSEIHKEGSKTNRGACLKDRDYNNTQSNNTGQIGVNKKTFISFNDIIQEMKVLSNKQNYANNEDTQEIKRLVKNASTTGSDLIGRLRDTGTSSSLKFGYFKFNSNKDKEKENKEK